MRRSLVLVGACLAIIGVILLAIAYLPIASSGQEWDAIGNYGFVSSNSFSEYLTPGAYRIRADGGSYFATQNPYIHITDSNNNVFKNYYGLTPSSYGNFTIYRPDTYTFFFVQWYPESATLELWETHKSTSYPNVNLAPVGVAFCLPGLGFIVVGALSKAPSRKNSPT
jgi:hypothetical protein